LVQLQAEGWTCQRVSRRTGAAVRRPFGVDLLAVRPERLLLVRVAPAGGLYQLVDQLAGRADLLELLRFGAEVEVWQWRKRRFRWELFRETVLPDEIVREQVRAVFQRGRAGMV
jgi:hypothetical protein